VPPNFLQITLLPLYKYSYTDMHKHTNRLINESSLYLQQHAHNPVNWYPWGEEALQKAKTENKIILVSIGYAACHWCHVMERESFENETVAAQMNQHFINIKIDREERPDIDHIYMDAVQAIAGNGGWPLNVFLTPDGRPFYGGTYFPPVRAYNRSSWMEVLDAIQKAWQQRAHEVESQAENLLNHLQQANDFARLATGENNFTKENCKQAAAAILQQADGIWGGFGKAPKFPQIFVIGYLLQYHHYTGDAPALQQALLSVDKMLDGGIYDHVGGGLARYSTDEEWLAPHFEKMLYDNALLLSVLADCYMLTRSNKYETAIRHIIGFLQREMQHPDGGFYAALDADSEGVEGKFYVWNRNDIEFILGDDTNIFCERFDVTEAGNWEHVNILRKKQTEAAFAQANGITVPALEAFEDKCLRQLLTARNSRVRPATDDKILLGWNALLITGLCKTAAALADNEILQIAVNNMQFLVAKFKIIPQGSALWHTYKNGQAKVAAFLDDYAYYIEACLHLHELTAKEEYLIDAASTTTFVIDNFSSDDDKGFLYYTHKNQQDVILRKKELYDGATPSGNSVMAGNLFYLSVILDKKEWYKVAEKMSYCLTHAITKYPSSFGNWASLLLKQSYGVHELVVIGPEHDTLRSRLMQQYLPGKVVQSAVAASDKYPMLAGKTPNGGTLIYWCRQYSCKLPVDNVEELLILMNNEIKK
jgi:uncharacterized protein